MQPPLFFFRKNARHPERAGAVLCRITLDKQQKEFTTPVHCLREEWDTASQRVKGKSKEARLSNSKLVDISADLTRIYYDMERAKEYITAERLYKRYLDNDKPKVTLLAAWQEFIDQRRPLVGISLGEAKIYADTVRRERVQQYLDHEQLLGLLPEEFTAKWADGFLRWLRVERGVSQNYAAKVMQTVKQVLKWCVRQEYIDYDPLEGYKLKFAPTPPPTVLSHEELQRLRSYKYASAALQRVADCFVFQCYTGLAYADLLRFRRTQHTRPGPDGKVWIYMPRQKTERSTALEATVRLMPPALHLLESYGDALPVPANQVYNRFLKEVAAVVGIDGKRLTTHVGRKTAGALLLLDGMSLEAVSKVLGHSSLAMTQKYYTWLTDTLVGREFKRLYDNDQEDKAAA